MRRVPDGNIKRRFAELPDTECVRELLKRSLVASPSATIPEGVYIPPGHDEELDRLRDLTQHSAQWLANLEARERERTGIATLKVGYNRVHGYYMEARSHRRRRRAGRGTSAARHRKTSSATSRRS